MADPRFLALADEVIEEAPVSPGAIALHDGAPQRIALCTVSIADADRVALCGCNDQCQSKLRIDKDRLAKNTQQGKTPAFSRIDPELVAITVVGRGSSGVKAGG